MGAQNSGGPDRTGPATKTLTTTESQPTPASAVCQAHSPSASSPRDLETAALEALEAGLRPIPIEPGGKKPLVRWEDYQKQAPTEAEVHNWWTEWPGANLAVLTGEASGLDILDLDIGHEDWPPAGCELPTGYVCLTPRGGQHYGFRHVPGCRNSAGKLAKGVDVRGDGGYVLIPPSVVGGKPYHLMLGPLAEALTTEPPPWLRAALLDGKPTSAKPTGASGTIPEGARNDTLARLAGAMRRYGAEEAELLAALKEANSRRCQPPLPDCEVESIAHSVGGYPPGEETPDKVTLNDFHTTDSGNAEAFASLFGDRLRFDHRQKRWLVFRPGLWWTEDADGDLDRMVLELARARQRAAVERDDADDRKELTRWALGTEARFRQQATLEVAKSVRPIADNGSGWDEDPWLLGVENGVVDLREGTLRPGGPEDRITMHAPITFDPDATCPRWERFLGEVFSEDADLVAFVHRLLGYTLTGSTREQVFVVLHGQGENGKSTFLTVLRNILGPFAHDCGFGLFERAVSAGPHPEALAELAGRRLVTASETGEKTKLNEQRLKVLSHGDVTSARFLHSKRFEFSPRAKIFLGLNHRPRVEDDSRGFWRSALLVPFLRQFRGGAADRELDQKLLAEAPGILAWAVRGCLYWQADGLCPPETVLSASAAWQAECDPLSAFLTEGCVEGEHCRVSSADLYRAYLKWADDEALPDKERLSHKGFGTRIGERYRRDRAGGTGGRVYLGIGLKTDPEGESLPF